jgi:hypothetical protein
VSTNVTVSSVEVYNSLGVKVLEVPIVNDKINIGNQANGIYLLRIKNSNGYLMSENIVLEK